LGLEFINAMKTSARLLVLAILVAAAPFARAETFNWPQWQGPTRNCMTKEKGLLKAWPDGGPKQKWLFDQCGAGYAGPAVVEGKLYILGTREGKCHLFAIDTESGSELWAAPISGEFHNAWGDGPRSTPNFDNGRLYVLSPDGVLACINAADGKEVWRVTMQSLGGKTPNWGFTESVLIDGDKLLCTPGGPQGAIVALNKADGKVIWQAKELTEFAHYASIVRGEFHGKPQYVQLLEKRLVGLSPEDGKLLWQVDWPGNVAVIPTPIIRGNQVFCTSGYGAGCMLVEINAKNEATKVWENKKLKSQHGGVINLGNYFYGYSDDIGWVCLDAKTGDFKWREREALGKGAIGYADDRFYCVDQTDGKVVLIDASPKAWTERGTFTLSPLSKNRSPKGGIWVHPVIVNGKLYLRDQEYVYCFDVKK
jgi:outer membrane protein assembly factor BamB